MAASSRACCDHIKMGPSVRAFLVSFVPFPSLLPEPRPSGGTTRRRQEMTSTRWSKPDRLVRCSPRPQTPALSAQRKRPTRSLEVEEVLRCCYAPLNGTYLESPPSRSLVLLTTAAAQLGVARSSTTRLGIFRRSAARLSELQPVERLGIYAVGTSDRRRLARTLGNGWSRSWCCPPIPVGANR